MRRALVVLAVVATPWLVLSAAAAGGWTRFGVGLIVGLVTSVYLHHELRVEHR